MQYLKTLVYISLIFISIYVTACESKQTPTYQSADTKTQKAAISKKAQPVLSKKKKTDPNPNSTKSTLLGIGKTPSDIQAGESNIYGERFTIIEESIALSEALKKAKQSEGPYKVHAMIHKVCQAKGCWFTLVSKDIRIPIRVRMKDYGFFVPRNAADLNVVIEGTLKKTTISQKMAQHYADDEAKNTGKPPEKVDGPQETFEMMATSVHITKS